MAVICVDEHEFWVLWLQGIWQQAEELSKTKFRFLFVLLFPYDCHPGRSALHVFYEKRAFAEMDTTAINFF